MINRLSAFCPNKQTTLMLQTMFLIDHRFLGEDVDELGWGSWLLFESTMDFTGRSDVMVEKEQLSSFITDAIIIVNFVMLVLVQSKTADTLNG